MHCFTIPIRFWALPLISSCFLIGSRSLELSNWWGWWCVGRRLSSWPLRTRFGDNINGRAAHWKHIRQRLSDNSFVVVICQTSSVGLTAVIVRTNRNEKNKQQTVIKISLQFSQHFLRRCIVLLSTRCFGHCTGCLLNSASTTSWPCWRSRLSRRHTAVSEPAHLVAHQRTQHSIVVCPTAVRAISTDIIRQTIVQHCRTSDLELISMLNCDFLYFQIQAENSHVLYCFL